MLNAYYRKIDEKKETYQVWIDEAQDENGNIIEGHYEEQIRIVPVYGTVYEEVDDLPQEEIPQSPTPEERIQALEKELAELKEALK